MEKEWLKALGKMTHGIYVLTTQHKSEINGMIASWVSQISYEPPMIMVAIHPNRYSHNIIAETGHFALHALGKSQADLISRFKGPDPSAKFESIPWFPGKTGCPILRICVSYMECEVNSRVSPGNHTVFIGEVKDAGSFSEEKPLNTADYSGVYVGKD
jgi:flavin reductase (DIM6/NTAB) family NADH-FMN oxidoreductase RutF